MKKILMSIFSSSDDLSSKRFITIITSLLFNFITLVDFLSDKFTMTPSILDAMVTIILAGLGTIVGDNLIRWKYGDKKEIK